MESFNFSIFEKMHYFKINLLSLAIKYIDGWSSILRFQWNFLINPLLIYNNIIYSRWNITMIVFQFQFNNHMKPHIGMCWINYFYYYYLHPTTNLKLLVVITFPKEKDARHSSIRLNRKPISFTRNLEIGLSS